MKPKETIRLGVVIGSAVFLAVFACSLVLGFQLKERLGGSLRSELRRDLLLNSQMLQEKPVIRNDFHSLQSMAERIGRALDIRATIIDIRGNLLGDSSLPYEKLRMAENHLGRPEVQQALKSGFGEDSRFSRTTGMKMLYMAVPLGSPQPYAVLRFAKTLYDFGIFGSGVENDLEKLLPLMLVLSMLAGIAIAHGVSMPLKRLSRIAEKRTRGDMSGEVPSKSNELTASIARALSVMSDEIRSRRWSGEWYQAAFSGIREAVIVTDADGDIILVNPAASRIFHIEGAMLKSRPLSSLADRTLRELLEKVHRERATLLKEEIPLVTGKGARIMQVSTMPIIRDETFEGIVFVLNDITKLRTLERMRRDFVSSVSHELRTPLSSIRGYTETLLEGAIDDKEHAVRFLQIILRESEQLTALVNDVLDLSKIESGRIEYHFTAVDLGETVRKSLVMLRQQIDEKGIRLEVMMPDELPKVLGDPAYLEIAVRNILDNAVKYVDLHDGRIRVRAFLCGENVHLEVQDNGIGISQQDLGRIFERFYRVDKARSRQSGGTGLGLSIVKHIMLAHRGNVEVRSRLNQGSVFSLILPVASDKA
ncbi:MAG: PAS domain-containing protein [Chlorobiaceae bacterium]|nr:PAS domain-containing protein [Chlorobiaceae bacterium]